MKSENVMASTVPGLSQRGSRWYVLIIVPPDLHEAYGKRRINLALHTSDRREATLYATVKRAEWLADFAAKRRELKPETLAVVTPEMAQELALRVRRRVLAQDDELRDDPKALYELTDVVNALRQRIGHGLTIGGHSVPVKPVERDESKGAGMSDEDAKTLAGLNTLLDEKAGADLARRRRTAVLPLVRLEAIKLGFAFDEATEGAQGALAACLTAYRKARQEVTERDAGQIVDTPEAPPRAMPSKAKERPKVLRDVFDRWKASGSSPRSKDSIAAYDRAVRQFEGKHPDAVLANMTRDMGDQYVSWLREDCNTPKTARDRLNAVKSLLKYAAGTLEWTSKHAWMGLDIKAKTTNPRRPVTNAELVVLFTTPLHTSYTLPDSRYAGGDAAYWIPLLGLYTGTRLGELCQLRTADIQAFENIPVVVLTDDGEMQKIKSEAGKRSVPLHSDLLRLGFLKYVESVRSTGADSLWPGLPLRLDKASDYFGRWFREFREPLGLIGTDKPTFHYFRHTVRPLMRRANFSESTQDKVTGHKTRGSIGSVVYDHWTLQEIQAAVEAIQYPVLNLPVVSPHATALRCD
jgi:integrase